MMKSFFSLRASSRSLSSRCGRRSSLLNANLLSQKLKVVVFIQWPKPGSYSLNILVGTCTYPILGILIPPFWLMVTYPRGFQARGSFRIRIAEANVKWVHLDPLMLYFLNILMVNLMEWRFETLVQCHHLSMELPTLPRNQTHVVLNVSH